MFEYKAKLVRIIDGDTIVFDIDLGFGIWKLKEHVRLARINTPETRTRDLVEKAKGIEAKDFVIRMLENVLMLEESEIILKTYKDSGKYGRFVADIYLKANDYECLLNDKLVETGHAVYVDY